MPGISWIFPIMHESIKKNIDNCQIFNHGEILEKIDLKVVKPFTGKGFGHFHASCLYVPGTLFHLLLMGNIEDLPLLYYN